jgi:hypothetical protein
LRALRRSSAGLQQLQVVHVLESVNQYSTCRL